MAEMLARLTAYELTEWKAYYTLEYKDHQKATLEAAAKSKANRAPKR